MKRSDFFFTLLMIIFAAFGLFLTISTCGKVLGAGFVSELNGKTLYEKNCKSCHGIDGKGNPKMAKSLKINLTKLDLTDEETVKKPDDNLVNVTREGAGKMKGYESKLSGEEIKAIVTYIRTLQK